MQPCHGPKAAVRLSTGSAGYFSDCCGRILDRSVWFKRGCRALGWRRFGIKCGSSWGGKGVTGHIASAVRNQGGEWRRQLASSSSPILFSLVPRSTGCALTFWPCLFSLAKLRKDSHRQTQRHITGTHKDTSQAHAKIYHRHKLRYITGVHKDISQAYTKIYYRHTKRYITCTY